MPNVNLPSINTRQKSTHVFQLFDNDGAVDPATPVVVANPNPAVAGATIDPADPRRLVITGATPGFTTISLNAPGGGVAVGGPLQYTISVAAAPPLSHIEHVSSTLPEPKA